MKTADQHPMVTHTRLVQSLSRQQNQQCELHFESRIITPEASTVADGSYAPLSRYIYMNVNNDDWDLVGGFIAYGYSDAGMDHVMDVGYVALPQAMIDEMIARMG